MTVCPRRAIRKRDLGQATVVSVRVANIRIPPYAPIGLHAGHPTVAVIAQVNPATVAGLNASEFVSVVTIGHPIPITVLHTRRQKIDPLTPHRTIGSAITELSCCIGPFHTPVEEVLLPIRVCPINASPGYPFRVAAKQVNRALEAVIHLGASKPGAVAWDGSSAIRSSSPFPPCHFTSMPKPILV